MKRHQNSLIEKYIKLNLDKKNPNCRIYSLAVFLNFNGIKISVDELILLAMTYWIRACYVKNYNKLNLVLPFAFPDNIEEVIFDKLNIQYRNIGQTIKRITDVDYYIEKKIPLLMTFDCNKLNKRQSSKNINIGVLSTAVVLARNDESLVFNSLGGGKEFVVPFEQFSESRYSGLMPVSAKGEVFVIDGIENLKEVRKIITEQIYETANNFLKEKNEAQVFDNEHGIFQYEGCRSFDVIVSYIEDLKEQLGSIDERLANKLFRLICSALRRGIASGSGSLSRIEYGVALKRMAEKEQCKELKMAANLIVKAGNRWRNLARKLYSPCVSYSKMDKYLMDLSAELYYIKEIEVEAMKRIVGFNELKADLM